VNCRRLSSNLSNPCLPFSQTSLIDGLNKISFICIFTIKDEHRTALDIANHSEIPDEEEVLILPYSSFKITNIMQNENQRRIEMYSEECDTVPLDFQTIV